MKYILLSAIFCVIASCNSFAQDSPTINVHLFSGYAETSTFSFKYEIDAEGENAVEKTTFENTIKLSLIETKSDTLYIEVEADSTKISNPNTLKDGDASLMFAMIGLNMKLTCNSEGELFEILNKDELLSEFKGGIQGLSEDRIDYLVQSILEEDEALFFEKMYEINYSLLLKNLSQDLIVPLESKKDSLIAETAETPNSTMETTHLNIDLGDKCSFQTIVIQTSEEFIQNETGYEIINKPIVSNTEQLLMTNSSGLVQSISSKSVVKMEGMVMKSDGAIMHEMKPFTQYSNMEYTRIE